MPRPAAPPPFSRRGLPKLKPRPPTAPALPVDQGVPVMSWEIEAEHEQRQLEEWLSPRKRAARGSSVHHGKPSTAPSQLHINFAQNAGWEPHEFEQIGKRVWAEKKWKKLGFKIKLFVGLKSSSDPGGYDASELVRDEAKRLVAQMDDSKVGKAAKETLEQSASMPNLPRHFGAMSTGVREDFSAQKMWKRAGKEVQQRRAFVRPVLPIARHAGSVYTADPSGPPKPIQSSAANFDKWHHRRSRRATLALKTLEAEPWNPTQGEVFDEVVAELFRSRYVLDAPVEHAATVYPDAVWGVSPDKLAYARATPQTSVRRVGKKQAEAVGKGLEYSVSYHKHRNQKLMEATPILPATRSPRKQAVNIYKALPDSNFALGNFHTTGGSECWAKDKNIAWKYYKQGAGAYSRFQADNAAAFAEQARLEAEAEAARLAEMAANAPPPDDWAPGGQFHHLIFGGPSDGDLMAMLSGEGGEEEEDDEPDWLDGDAVNKKGKLESEARLSVVTVVSKLTMAVHRRKSEGVTDDLDSGDSNSRRGRDGSNGGGGLRNRGGDSGGGMRNHGDGSGRNRGGDDSLLEFKQFLGPNGDTWSLVDEGTEGNMPSLNWLDGSVWRARKFGPRPADSHDYVDTRECLKSLFESDWQNTSGAAVLKDKKGNVPRAFGLPVESPMTHEALRAIAKEIERWYPLLLRMYTFYSCIGADIANTVNGLPGPGYSLLLGHARLDISNPDVLGRTCRFARNLGGDGWDLVWVSVNCSALSTSQAAWNNANRLTRSEFIEFIVRASVSEKDTPEEAPKRVKQFCEEVISFVSMQPDVDTIMHNSDTFRREHCYRRETDAMLKHHEETLRSIFKVYAEKGAGGIEVDGATDLLSTPQWMALMRDLGFTKECGQRQLYLIFAQSRMSCVKESNVKGQLTQLPYEGFLEAIVRLSLLKALPTDKELKKKDFQVPGEYIGAILNRGLSMYEAWVTANKRAQAAGRGDPIYRRVDMLILLIVSVMQYGVEQQPGGPSLLLRGHPDEILSLDEVKRYWKKPTRTVFEESQADGLGEQQASSSNTPAAAPSRAASTLGGTLAAGSSQRKLISAK